jgi:hypothetical protein
MSANDEEKAGQSEQKAQEDGSMPGHLTMQEISTKSYQTYLRHLKTGGKSGISDIFGSAADIFGGELNLQHELIDWAKWDKGPELLRHRSTNLTSKVVFECGQFLDQLCQEIRCGALSTAQTKDIPEERYSASLKGLCTAYLLLLSFEQIVDESVTPRWARVFLWDALQGMDEIMPLPPSVNDILNMLCQKDEDDIPQFLREAAICVCSTLKAGSVGEPAWLAVHDFLSKAAARRATLALDSLQTKNPDLS